jgi:type III secretory pathway component EscU
MFDIFRNKNLFLFSCILLLCLASFFVDAQCPMCRMSAESNLKDGGTMAAGLNKGIIYLLMIPYLLISVVGFVWWRNQRLVEIQEQEDEIKDLLASNNLLFQQEDLGAQ